MHRLASLSSPLLALVFVVSAADPARATSIVELDRRVVTSSFVEAYVVGSDDDVTGFQSSDPGAFLEAAVDGSLIGDITNAFGEAFQDTDVRFGPGNGFRITGSGGSGFGIDVRDPGYPSRAQGQSDTSLTLTFEVTSSLEFSFGIALSAELVQLDVHSGEGPISGTVSAYARLYGLAGGFLLDLAIEDIEAGDAPVEDARVLTGVLAPDLYVLEVGTLTSMRGFEDSIGLVQAGFGIDFLAIPEPGSALLLALGLGALATGRGRSEVGGRRARRAGPGLSPRSS